MKTSVSKVNLWQQIPYATYLRGLAALLDRARISYRIKIGSISLFMKSTLSLTLGTNKEETATTILYFGLTYIAFPPSPKAAYECSASSITHHKYPYFRRRAFQTLCTCVLSVIHFLGIICLPFQYPSLKYNFRLDRQPNHSHLSIYKSQAVLLCFENIYLFQQKFPTEKKDLDRG